MNNKIAIIGCGNLGRSIIHGLLEEGTLPAEMITATKRNPATLFELETVGIKTTSDNCEAVRNSDIIILAIKPYNIDHVVEEIKAELDPDRHILVSVATGITINHIHNAIGKNVPVFRAMPNTASDVRESLTCIAHNGGTEEQLHLVTNLFNHIGITIHIEEHLMEAATIMGACGVAYVMRFIRAMVQGGIQIGFSAEIASQIVNQTVKGTAELLIERKQHPEHEIDKVTTPKGCTIVGLNEMEHNGFSSSLIKGIVASYQKIEK